MRGSASPVQAPTPALRCSGSSHAPSWQSCRALLDGTNVTRVSQVARRRGSGASTRSDLVFVVGGFKTGTTSLIRALKHSGLTPACKPAWFSNGPAMYDASWSLAAVAEFIASPLAHNTSLGQLIHGKHSCRSLADAPWQYLFPTLMRSVPNARFILTRRRNCTDWVKQTARLLHNQYVGRPDCRSSDSREQCAARQRERAKRVSEINADAPLASAHKLSLQSCFYGLGCGADHPLRRTAALWQQRCVEHERSALLTAKALGVSLLVLDVDLPDAEKAQRLQRFLAPQVTHYPRASTRVRNGFSAAWLDDVLFETQVQDRSTRTGTGSWV